MVPVKALLKRSILLRPKQFPSVFGSVELNLFPYISRFSRAVKRPISDGIVPVICVRESMNSLTFVSCPRDDDSDPVNKFVLKWSFSRFVKPKTSSGMVPLKRQPPRFMSECGESKFKVKR